MIQDKIDRLRKEGLKLTEEYEGDVYSFLGVEVRTSGSQIELVQTGLIDKILHTCGMAECNTKATPANTTPLATDANGPRCEAEWDFAAVVGMLMYLSSNTRPDIQFAVHQCARFTHCPRRSHEQAILRICRYLKGTKTKGMVFTPDPNMKLDLYCDADFAGLWGVENAQYPVCVKSRTGFVLMLGGCPLLWVSKLQQLTTLSTCEAEYVALSHAMRELLPMRELLQEIGTKMDWDFGKPALVHSTVFEDNNGALALANSGRVTPRTKHIAVKMHHFREHVGKDKGIEIVKVDTSEQLADILTKGMPAVGFQKIRKLLLGW